MVIGITTFSETFIIAAVKTDIGADSSTITI